MQKHMLMLEVVLMGVLGLWMLTGYLSSAEAVIVVRSAAVQNGVAVLEGGNAARSAPISWEGTQVTQANNGGNFAFQGVVPADCVGSLHEGDPTAAIAVALANCSPVSETLALVPQTGQTLSYVDGDDGDIQAGVPLPRAHFTDHGNGTVRDHLTGLTWLKDAGCLFETWAEGFVAVADLNAGIRFNCVEYVQGTFTDWRFPNFYELRSLVHSQFFGPALSNAAGTGQWTVGDPFVNMRPHFWSSTTRVSNPEAAVLVSIGEGGDAFSFSKGDGSRFPVWPVRGPE